MPKIAIRKAMNSDATALAALYGKFYAEDAIAVPAQEVLKNLTAMLRDDRAALWVAEDGGQIVGFSSATLTLGVEFGWASEIEDLYVLPEFRGKGLARALFLTAVDWAEASGATEILLVVTPEAEADQGLVAFYEKLGFVKSNRAVLYKSGRQ